MEITIHRERADQQGGEHGFALVLTLVVILALSLLTELMTRWVASALESALANRTEADAKRRIAEAQAVALYVSATRPRSFRGIELLTIAQLRPSARNSPGEAMPSGENYIRLDDHPY